jgi:hypothetical protein
MTENMELLAMVFKVSNSQYATMSLGRLQSILYHVFSDSKIPAWNSFRNIGKHEVAQNYVTATTFSLDYATQSNL